MEYLHGLFLLDGVLPSYFTFSERVGVDYSYEYCLKKKKGKKKKEEVKTVRDLSRQQVFKGGWNVEDVSSSQSTKEKRHSGVPRFCRRKDSGTDLEKVQPNLSHCAMPPRLPWRGATGRCLPLSLKYLPPTSVKRQPIHRMTE